MDEKLVHSEHSDLPMWRIALVLRSMGCVANFAKTKPWHVVGCNCECCAGGGEAEPEQRQVGRDFEFNSILIRF